MAFDGLYCFQVAGYKMLLLYYNVTSLATNSGSRMNDMPRIGDDWPPENYWAHSSDRLSKPPLHVG